MFISFGASASVIGQLFTDYQDVLRKVGGVLIVMFGLYLMNIVKLQFLMTEHRIHFASRPVGYIGSFLIGATFAAGWTPCVGPVLGTVLLYAGTSETLMDGVALLTFYSMGLGLPLLITALALDRFFNSFKQLRAHLGLISRISGVFLVALGIVVYRMSLPCLSATGSVPILGRSSDRTENQRIEGNRSSAPARIQFASVSGQQSELDT